MLNFISPISGQPLYQEGDFLVAHAERFPVIGGIPRFVNPDNYANPFGFQWKQHRQTQLDSYSGVPISRMRLERCLGGSVSELKGQLVLEAGCGAGRFTEILVEAGAFIHAVDLSLAVEANFENIGSQPNYRIAQADILALPFESEAFDVVICLGVLQHLPSPETGLRSLWNSLKPGGLLVIDHYTPALSLITRFINIYRLPIRKLPPNRARKIVDTLVNIFFPLHWGARRFYLVELILSRISPCIFHFHSYPELSREQHYDWSRLDSFDYLTDYYKHLRTVRQIRQFLTKLGAEEIVTRRGGNGVEARCRKPTS